MPQTLPNLPSSADKVLDNTMDFDKPKVSQDDLRRQEKLRKDEEKYEAWVVSTDTYSDSQT